MLLQGQSWLVLKGCNNWWRSLRAGRMQVSLLSSRRFKKEDLGNYRLVKPHISAWGRWWSTSFRKTFPNVLRTNSWLGVVSMDGATLDPEVQQTKPCIWERRALGTRIGWETAAWRPSWQKRTWGPIGHQTDLEPALCPLWQRPMAPGDALGVAIRAAWGRRSLLAP